MGIEANLKRWQKVGVLDEQSAARILAYESSRRGSRFTAALLGLGALAIFLGFAAIIGSNWDAIPAWLKMTAHTIINLGLAAGIVFALVREKTTLREMLLFLLAGFTLTFIALIGQIYQTGAPLWQALSLWLLIVSPFLFAFARARFTIVCWIIAFLITLGYLFEPLMHALGPANIFDLTLYTLVPFVLIGVGQSSRLRIHWPSWPLPLAMTGYVVLAAVTSSTQTIWSFDTMSTSVRHAFDDGFSFDQARLALAVGFAAAGFLYVLRRFGQLVARDALVDVFAAVSVLACFLPIVMAHPEMPVVGAITFMAYWALIGWTALSFNYRGLLSLATIMIALRLVIVYVEIFGSMLSTGFGLIISGVLLILLVLGTQKLIRKFSQLTRPI
jgi:uncharacterized membrane protein